MAALGGAVLLLVLSHALPSAPTVRRTLVQSLGRRAFYAGYSLVSLLALALVVMTYRRADPGLLLYTPPDGARLATLLVMPLAAFLTVAGLTSRPGDRPHGIYRITTVPGSVGVLLWAVLHLANLGAARQVILFAGMASIALVALSKNLMSASGPWRDAGAMPFLAVLRGRERLNWTEIGWWRVALALALYLGVLRLHPLVIGPDPLAAAL